MKLLVSWGKSWQKEERVPFDLTSRLQTIRQFCFVSHRSLSIRSPLASPDLNEIFHLFEDPQKDQIYIWSFCTSHGTSSRHTLNISNSYQTSGTVWNTFERLHATWISVEPRSSLVTRHAPWPSWIRHVGKCYQFFLELLEASKKISEQKNFVARQISHARTAYPVPGTFLSRTFF